MSRSRTEAAEILRSGKPLYRGSLIRYSRRCGGARCKCTKGKLHSGWALSRSVGGKTEVVYLPEHLRGEVAKGLRNHQKAMALLEQIVNADVARLRKKARRYRTR